MLLPAAASSSAAASLAATQLLVFLQQQLQSTDVHPPCGMLPVDDPQITSN
jgi:hypothetical protein